ncbi:MAG: DUF4445 domain-containing protein [Clostridia bacterium]|nr:DUF4445 domain-containing protein [Clostridia bacterium]
MSKPTRIRLGSSAVGQNLAEYLARTGYLVHADCGGRGTCGKCRVQLAGGFLYENPACTRVAQPDKDGYVLACRTWCCSGAVIVLPEQKGDGLTAFDAQAQAKTAQSGLGIALDIGTTTLAAALVDLEGGNVLATTSALNPQISYGADVISRIQSATERPETLTGMQNALLCRVRDMIAELAHDKPILRMTVAGNPTMLHIFCGASPAGMGAYPFTPAFTEARTVTGAELDLPVPTVTCLPSISAFVGGDITAGMLHTNLTDAEQPALLLDIGTNGESVLFTGKARDARLYAASAAAGPALEGAGISCGMGGITGAVSAVRLQGNTPICSTVGNAPAQGICGSGLVDLISCLYTAGLMDETGALEHGDSFAFATTQDGTPLCLTQADIRALQLCKSAIRASVETLCLRAGVSPDALDRVYLAGGLGYYINVSSAVRIGLLPAAFMSRTESVGNAALGGCVRALLNPDAIDRMQAEATRTHTLELSTDSAWNEAFMEHMMFPDDII